MKAALQIRLLSLWVVFVLHWNEVIRMARIGLADQQYVKSLEVGGRCSTLRTKH